MLRGENKSLPRIEPRIELQQLGISIICDPLQLNPAGHTASLLQSSQYGM